MGRLVARVDWRRWGRGAAVVLLALAASAYGSAWVVPLPERLQTPGSTVFAWHDGSPAQIELSPDEKWRIPVALDAVDPDYVDALVRLEDKRFWVHPGVDPLAIGRAMVDNASAGEVVSGASTLTMQLVRLAEPRPRTLGAKAVEALRAMQLEIRLSKAEILAAYLTLTPYGRNVEGIEAASWAYFGHAAADLSPTEMATLLAVPQNPNRRYPHPDNAVRLQVARDDIAARLLAEDALPTGSDAAPLTAAEVHAQVVGAAVPTRLEPVPRALPHAATWLAPKVRDERLVTTLDEGVQVLAERVLAGHRAEAERKGIHNATVVVVEHDSAEVRALIGSFDFWDEGHGGQIIGFDTPRSPGSTLKPLIYARAIDDGVVLPEHLRPDIPVSYGSYAPENYDGRFAGVVSMEEALSRSLNVPFVVLLSDIGLEPFLGDLRAMGATHLVEIPGYYGLSTAAGGIELTPLEMAGFFTTLARKGSYRPLSVVVEPHTGKDRAIYREGTAWLTSRALQLRDRPDFPSRRDLSTAPRRIQWKTGTSFGNRDAWAIGSGERYTVVVWLGNFDHTPSGHLIGAEAAGPILFDLLEALGDGADDAPPPPPPSLVEVDVCALSGHLPTSACPHRTTALALQHRVPTTTCPYHRGVEVDIATGLAVTPGCRSGRTTETRTYVLWPSRVRRWLDDHRVRQPHPPALDPTCAPLQTAKAPRILSPSRGEVSVLLPGVSPEDQQIPFEAESEVADTELSWFVDGVFLGTVAADERLWWTPAPGVHQVVVMDGHGSADRLEVEVRGMAVARRRP